MGYETINNKGHIRCPECATLLDDMGVEPCDVHGIAYIAIIDELNHTIDMLRTKLRKALCSG